MGQVPPNCIGDPYVDHPKPDPRLLGRNLVCTTSKTGKVGVGTTFSYAQPNCVGDPYSVPGGVREGEGGRID